MSQWIHTTNSNLRSIKIDGMDDDVWFTDNGYSEVSQSVADLLAALDSISKVSPPGSPGDYYESDYDGTTINVNLDSDSFQSITVGGTVSATDITSETITTDSLVGGWDYLVTTATELVDVLNNQVSNGETVAVAPGEYVVKEIYPTVDDVRLVGQNREDTIIKLDPNATTGVVGSKETLLALVDVSGWTIEGLTFDGNYANQNDPANIEDSVNCVNFVGCSDVTIRNSIVQNNHANGIYVTNGTTDFHIENCIVDRCSTPILHYRTWRGRAEAPVGNGVIHNCTIRNSDDIDAGAWGIYFSGGAHDVVVSDCLIYGNQSNQTRVDGVDGTKRIRFVNNIIDTTDGVGAWVTNGAKWVTYEGNTFMSDGTVDTGTRQLYIVSSGGSADYFRIVNNEFWKAGDTAVEITNGVHGVFAFNDVYESSIYGIKLNGSNDATIFGNVFQNTGVGGGGAAGINLDNSSNHLVAMNRVVNGEGGITEANGADNNQILWNISNGNTSYQYSLEGPNSVVKSSTPEFDTHRGLTDGDSDNTITVTFDKPYANRPRLAFGRVGGGITNVAYTTNGSGDYDGATVSISTTGGTIDAYVEAA